MFLRILLSIFILSLSLFGAPSFSEMKDAVNANPELLDTPQAKAMMKEKGVTADEVRAKLQQEAETAKKVVTVEDIENKIEVVDEDDTVDSNEIDIVQEVETDNVTLNKRLNPFEYKSSADIREELNAKQQILTSMKLTRYSSSFYANQNLIDSSSLPTPENYNISTGDILNLHIYGDRDKEYELVVSNEGNVELEFIGPVRVGGKSYKEVKDYLSSKLSKHFKMSSFNITIAKYSSIQVTLIGDVKHPGIYNLSSFSTAKDLLIASKGVRDSASVREILIKRNSKTVASLDFYDLLFKGKNISSTLLKHGDIVVIKKAKKLVSIDGFVNHAAIFELDSYERLDKLIEYAGGMKSNASKMNIKIDRYSDNTIFETFKIPFRDVRKFKMKDGDKVYIYPLDSSAETSVNLYGNVIRPGSYRVGESKTLTQFFKQNLSHGIKKFFLPETYFGYGVIKRYSSFLNYETKSFDLKKVISGEEILELKPQDEIYIFNKSDISSSSYITTKGDVLINSGKLRYFDGMTIQDAVHASGIDGIVDDKIRVTTINTPNRMPKTLFYSLKKDGATVLSAYDEVEVYDYYKTHLLEPISIKGEVVNPTTVFYEDGMSLYKLLDISGGLTSMAYLSKVEIVRYYLDKKHNRQKKIIYIDLRNIDKTQYALKAYDEVTIYKIPRWSEKETIEIRGEVKFPGIYTIGKGEKLSSVIQRAGGYTNEAFIQGAVFTRDSIRENQIKQYNRALAQIKRELAIYNAMPANSKKAGMASNAGNALNEVMEEAKKYQPIGRVSIKLEVDLYEFEKSEYNLALKDKDTITIPNQIDTVTVFGEVFNPTSFVYNSEKSVDEYINMASGFARAADESRVYVIHADGTSEPIDTGWFSSSVKVQKGDTIVVPIYIKEYDTLEVADTVARILTSFALTAASLSTLGVL